MGKIEIKKRKERNKKAHDTMLLKTFASIEEIETRRDQKIEAIESNIKITQKSLFDNCNEGIKLKNKPVFSVQYHPESNPGPQDSVYLFEEFINNMKKNAKKNRS